MDTALFFSLTGRARRLHWWAGMAAMSVVVAIIQVAASLLGLGPWGLGRQVTGDAQALVDAHNATAWYGIALMLLFAWPYFALAIKRRHDRGSSGLDVTIFVAFLALLQLWRGTRIGFSAAEIPPTSTTEGVSAFLVWMPQPPLAYLALSSILAAYAFYLVIVLGFAPGTPGPNRYGEDPTPVRKA